MKLVLLQAAESAFAAFARCPNPAEPGQHTDRGGGGTGILVLRVAPEARSYSGGGGGVKAA